MSFAFRCSRRDVHGACFESLLAFEVGCRCFATNVRVDRVTTVDCPLNSRVDHRSGSTPCWVVPYEISPIFGRFEVCEPMTVHSRLVGDIIASSGKQSRHPLVDKRGPPLCGTAVRGLPASVQRIVFRFFFPGFVNSFGKRIAAVQEPKGEQRSGEEDKDE